ncbi:DUF6585 family protein [Actinocorallia longicatena]|uniref:PH (Pleckstrin Homology) domain-containing protein n=1 Tax=Actinocorallia longicatena TaxID=111803 RepID=A0ABP6PWZ1_9ACTN
MAETERREPPVPGEAVRAAAAGEGLGRPRASYGPRSRTGEIGARTMVVTVAGLVPLVIGLVSGELLWLVVGVPVAGVGVLGLLTNRTVDSHNAGMELHIFDNGLVVVVRGRAEHVFRWDSMTVLQEIISHRSYGGVLTHVYTLRKPGGGKVRIGREFHDPEVWGVHIQQSVTAARLPDALRRLEAGEAVAFGPIEVTGEGIRDGRRHASWGEVEVRIEEGTLCVDVGRRAIVFRSVDGIPNLYLLLALTDHLTRTR